MPIDDLVLHFDPPAFSLDEARQVLETHFGVSGELKALAGEREQNVRVETPAGELFVLKIAGRELDRGRLDFESQLLAHLNWVAPDLGVPRVIKSKTGDLFVDHRFAEGAEHPLRLLTYLEGRPLGSSEPLETSVFFEMGRLQGSICRALAGFFHPAARSPIPWDSSSDRLFDQALFALLDEETEDALARHLKRLQEDSLPALQRSRAQVIHNDLHTGNVLLDHAGAVSGVIDFGDSLHGPLLQDLAVSVSGLAELRHGEAADAITALVRGFETAFPLLPEERALLLDAAILRSLLSVELCRIKADGYPEVSRHGHVLEDARQGLFALLALQEQRAKARPARIEKRSTPLIERRRQAMSPTYKLFYDEPLEIVRGTGSLLYDAAGREYLDCYNNVPSVGHAHPRVVQALSQQAALLNTHTRYLHDEVVTYCERLAATFPAELDMCLLVCTGSEANDLAYSIARHVTGREGAAVWERCYHGNSGRTDELSLYDKDEASRAPHIAGLPIPDLYRGPGSGADYVTSGCKALEALADSPHGLAMLLVDSIFDCAGIYTAPDGYLAALFDRVRQLGGLVVADEVQSGLCRLGDHTWGFQDSGVVPDIVTLGKPMGGGHPLGAVVAKRWVLEAFAAKKHYFNTFGGNPVSAAVGNAVLDVVQEEEILANVHRVGGYLSEGLLALRNAYPVIGDVRGKGFFVGVELVAGQGDSTPTPDATRWVLNDMRRRGVLVATTGLHSNVIKIRPPLVFSHANADRLLETFEASLKGWAAKVGG